MKNSLWSVVVFLLSLSVYIISMAPSVGFTDAGELAGACYSLGVAHPTGYPLFVLLGFVWSHLPIPLSVIAKLNLFAAVCTAFSTVFVFRLSLLLIGSVLHQPSTSQGAIEDKAVAPKKRREKSALNKSVSSTASPVDKDPTSGVAANALSDTFVSVLSAATALSYAFARTVWSQATSIEVYSLHLCLMTLSLWLSVDAVMSGSKLKMRFAALSLGLCFTNHLTTILIIVPILGLYFYRPGELFRVDRVRVREFLILLLIIMSCSVLYASLAWNSNSGPWFNWGAVHRGWEQFSYHVFGKQYSIWMFSDEKGAVSKQFKVFLGLIGPNTAYVGVLLSVVGLWFTMRLKQLRSYALFLSLLIICGVAYSVNYSIHDIDSYFLSAYTALTLSAGMGLALVLRYRKTFAAAAFVLPLILLLTNWKENDQHDNTLVREYVHMMVDPLPKNAILFSQQWDYFCSAFWYMQQVEGYRPDVVLIEKELLRRTWYPRQLERWYPWAIAKSDRLITDYLQDLQLFELNADLFNAQPERVRVIQQKFIALLNSVVRTNITERPIFATQEVFEGEQGFGSGYVLSPFAMTIRIATDSSSVVADTASFSAGSFAAACSKHHDDHLERGIASTAALQLLSNVPSLAISGRTTEADWFCRQALLIEPRNSTAIQYRERLRAQGR